MPRPSPTPGPGPCPTPRRRGIGPTCPGAGARAPEPPPGPAPTVSFGDLDLAIRNAEGSAERTEVRFDLPPEVFVADNRKARIRLSFAYGERPVAGQPAERGGQRRLCRGGAARRCRRRRCRAAADHLSRSSSPPRPQCRPVRAGDGGRRRTRLRSGGRSIPRGSTCSPKAKSICRRWPTPPVCRNLALAAHVGLPLHSARRLGGADHPGLDRSRHGGGAVDPGCADRPGHRHPRPWRDRSAWRGRTCRAT